ncbi:MAG: phosphoadenylyl-sulfate reductase [Robiginitomaculum sp.]|nr:MAG: phosphoadenylyl-sulfate reductase [Robiginitomaculum sp.]
MTDTLTILTETAQRFPDMNLSERLAKIRALVSGRIVFTSSLGAEDQAITHAIFSQKLDIEVVTLDTGRLFEESYDLWAETEKRYGQKIKSYAPDTSELETLIGTQGVNGFFDSIEKRKHCCFVRKVVPLGRALEGASLWITGIRADQSAGRGNLAFFDTDAGHDVLKANPMLDWSVEQLDAYIETNDIPVNTLHARGFPSIGCQPCTRAVKPGEDARAGRWWWENENGNAAQECGLHVGPDGRLVRTRKQDIFA